MLVLAAAGLAGCRQDMHDQPGHKRLRPSTFFADGRMARPQIVGTVARGQLREDAALYAGVGDDNKPVDAMPIALDRTLLQRGQERFNIYCAPCHSRTGDGDGMIVRRGYLRPPSFHIERLRQAPLGHFYRVISNGLGGMPDYSAQISPQDRWAIVAYIRALQLSQNATVEDVPTAARPQLDAPKPPVEGATGRTGVDGKEPPAELQQKTEPPTRTLPSGLGEPKKEEKQQ